MQVNFFSHHFQEDYRTAIEISILYICVAVYFLIIFVTKRRIMPRPKKRQMEEDTTSRNTKKQKNTHRRYSKNDEFNHKRCLAWFNDYTSPDDPHNLGE